MPKKIKTPFADLIEARLTELKFMPCPEPLIDLIAAKLGSQVDQIAANLIKDFASLGPLSVKFPVNVANPEAAARAARKTDLGGKLFNHLKALKIHIMPPVVFLSAYEAVKASSGDLMTKTLPNHKALGALVQAMGSPDAAGGSE